MLVGFLMMTIGSGCGRRNGKYDRVCDHGDENEATEHRSYEVERKRPEGGGNSRIMLDIFGVWQGREARTNLEEVIVLETLGGCDLLGDDDRVGQILIRKLV
jgi:hypothetical protein